MTAAKGIAIAIIPATSINHRNALNMLASLSSLSTRALDEAIRTSDQKFRNGFFTGLLVCTAIVLIGVILEEAEIFPLPIRRYWIDLETGLTVRNHRLDRWLERAARIGWLLIIFGVLGEGLFEELASRADAILQNFDEIIVSDTQRETALAEERAADAKAGNVALGIELETAKGDVAKATKNAAVATIAAERERIERLKLEKQIAPRRLTENQKLGLLLICRRFRYRSVKVVSYALDTDGGVLAKQIAQSLNCRPGLSVEDDTASMMPVGGFITGIKVDGTDNALVSALRDELSPLGGMVSGTAPEGSSISTAASSATSATILVGTKPPPQ
jgi:hypothetical protein